MRSSTRRCASDVCLVWSATCRGRRREFLVRELDAGDLHVQFDEEMWKRRDGLAIEAPPDKRGGNRQAVPWTTSPHPYSTCFCPSISSRPGQGDEWSITGSTHGNTRTLLDCCLHYACMQAQDLQGYRYCFFFTVGPPYPSPVDLGSVGSPGAQSRTALHGMHQGTQIPWSECHKAIIFGRDRGHARTRTWDRGNISAGI
jgi:hypothetical protein